VFANSADLPNMQARRAIPKVVLNQSGGLVYSSPFAPFVNIRRARTKGIINEFHPEGRTRLSSNLYQEQVCALFGGGILTPNGRRVNAKRNGPDETASGPRHDIFSCRGTAPRHMTCDALCLRSNSRSHAGELLDNECSAVTLSPDEKSMKER